MVYLLINFEVVVKNKEGFLGCFGVPPVQEGDVASLPPHLCEVNQGRVQPDGSALLGNLANVRGEDPRDQGEPGGEVPLQVHHKVS